MMAKLFMSIAGLLLTGVLGAAPVFSAESGSPQKFILTSSAFQPGAEIPRKYTCDGDDVSPPLRWENPPAGTKAFAMIADDPDAPGGTWVHWVIYDLPAETKELTEGLPKTEVIAGGAKQGINDFRKVGYGGPCPPSGSAHRYFFKLYALDAATNLKPREMKQQLLDALKAHVLAETDLTARYKR
ncbi:MAG: YbhB/YbcL family Raf kinase inhibitor-like protein [Candidatus Binatia bacterium]